MRFAGGGTGTSTVMTIMAKRDHAQLGPTIAVCAGCRRAIKARQESEIVSVAPLKLVHKGCTTD